MPYCNHSARYNYGIFRSPTPPLPSPLSPTPLSPQTYNVDRQTPDSAGTATAFLCGVKGNYGTVGVDSRVAREDCSSYRNANTHTDSILRWSLAAGKRSLTTCCVVEAVCFLSSSYSSYSSSYSSSSSSSLVV